MEVVSCCDKGSDEKRSTGVNGRRDADIAEKPGAGSRRDAGIAEKPGAGSCRDAGISENVLQRGRPSRSAC